MRWPARVKRGCAGEETAAWGDPNAEGRNLGDFTSLMTITMHVLASACVATQVKADSVTQPLCDCRLHAKRRQISPGGNICPIGALQRRLNNGY